MQVKIKIDKNSTLCCRPVQMESFKPKFSLYNWTPTEMNVERQTHLYHLENKVKNSQNLCEHYFSWYVSLVVVEYFYCQ